MISAEQRWQERGDEYRCSEQCQSVKSPRKHADEAKATGTVEQRLDSDPAPRCCRPPAFPPSIVAHHPRVCPPPCGRTFDFAEASDAESFAQLVVAHADHLCRHRCSTRCRRRRRSGWQGAHPTARRGEGEGEGEGEWSVVRCVRSAVTGGGGDSGPKDSDRIQSSDCCSECGKTDKLVPLLLVVPRCRACVRACAVWCASRVVGRCGSGGRRGRRGKRKRKGSAGEQQRDDDGSQHASHRRRQQGQQQRQRATNSQSAFLTPTQSATAAAALAHSTLLLLSAIPFHHASGDGNQFTTNNQ